MTLKNRFLTSIVSKGVGFKKCVAGKVKGNMAGVVYSNLGAGNTCYQLGAPFVYVGRACKKDMYTANYTCRRRDNVGRKLSP